MNKTSKLKEIGVYTLTLEKDGKIVSMKIIDEAIDQLVNDRDMVSDFLRGMLDKIKDNKLNK